MEYNNIKKIGKIHDYDGEAGTIITPDNEYLFNNQNIKDKESIKNEDFVSFYPSTVKFGNEIFKVAREIEVIQKTMVKRP